MWKKRIRLNGNTLISAVCVDVCVLCDSPGFVTNHRTHEYTS